MGIFRTLLCFSISLHSHRDAAHLGVYSPNGELLYSYALLEKEEIRKEVRFMACHACHSAMVREYNAETVIHFPGMKGLNIPAVWVFPKFLVCLDCGTTQFVIPDAELKTLTDRDYRTWTDEAVV